MDQEARIVAKIVLGLPLTAQERATYLLLIATDEEARAFLECEKSGVMYDKKRQEFNLLILARSGGKQLLAECKKKQEEVAVLEKAIDLLRERACCMVSNQRRCSGRNCDGCYLRREAIENFKAEARAELRGRKLKNCKNRNCP